MHELVVISGKGGTGKTSITASLALLAGQQAVIADADVDAADLHLLLAPIDAATHPFEAGHLAVVDSALCQRCGTCQAVCAFDAATLAPGQPTAAIDPLLCEGCHTCVTLCPEQAIRFPARRCGDWSIATSRGGQLVHARLRPGAENSGKLVTQVRRAARELATARGLTRLIVDGPPGIGCPVIAAITQANQVLVVTEPTVSGLHDLRRVVKLAKHLSVPAAMVINRWDLSVTQSRRLEVEAQLLDLPFLGRIPYDPQMRQALRQEQTIIEYAPGSPAARAIRELAAALHPPFRSIQTTLPNSGASPHANRHPTE